MEKRKTRIRVGRILYLILAILFALCITAQIFIAGLATFVNPINWMKHTTFVHLFGFNLPILMLVFAFVGALPRWAYWQLLGLLGLIFTMYFSANMSAVLPWISALHPLIAVLLFILSCAIVLKTWKLILNKEDNQKGGS
ncbi:DUF6220 domain-containing protein [Virgibacillus necropolis]|uniref:DUF6220 domain-containing protein n=1 Tax=Virgibacillus necropolis TaxID=163877 RepID=UPI00384BB4AF